MPRYSRAGETRAASTREATERRAPQAHYQSKLFVPKSKIPPGMTYAWVREATLNEPDPDNMTDRMIRGWAPVPADRHQEMVPPPLPGYEGVEVRVIRRGGLILCERPTRDVEEDKRAKDRENMEILQDISWAADTGIRREEFVNESGELTVSRAAEFRDD